MSLLFKTTAEMSQLRLHGGLFAGGGFLLHGLMIKHNWSFLETPVCTQLLQLDAGCWQLSASLRCFICLLWPCAPLTIISASRLGLWMAGRCQRAELTALAWTSPVEITLALGASLA